MNKRQFLQTLALSGLSMPAWSRNLDKALVKVHHKTPEEIALDEDFWAEIRKGYRLKSDYINLENGYYCILPTEILEKSQAHQSEVNFQGSYYMRTRQFPDKLEIRKKLADVAGCSFEELIVTRNTTESLDTVIAGIDWKAEDEAIMAVQDYGAMLDMFKLQARRYGIVNKVISIPNHPKSDEEIVALYENAITPKTRLIMVCHMINITGQILPVRKICDMAHKHGVEVLVDGAHAFAHIEFKISDLNCDYYGTSLHKWLSVPLGAGVLYVRKEKIKNIWQMFGNMGFEDTDIRKLNHTGTTPVHTSLTIPDAIEFYQKLGPARKEARLRYLQSYWTSAVRNLPKVIVNTPAEKERSCGIANVGIEGIKPSLMEKILLEKYKIYTVPIENTNVQGCRITPNIYTTTQELDTFIAAIKDMAKV